VPVYSAKPMAIILLLIVVGLIVVMTYKRMNSNKGVLDDMRSEIRYSASVPYVVAKQLAKTMPGASVLVITNPDIDPGNKFYQAKKEALEKGFGTAITDVIYDSPKPKLTPEAKKKGYSLNDLVTSADIDKLLVLYPQRKLVVMFAPLPRDMEKMKIWRQFERDKKNTPKLALLSDNVYALGLYIKEGLIAAAAVNDPDYLFSEGKLAPEDLDAAFHERYILLTPDNVLKVAKEHPKLFKKKKK